MPAKTNTNTNTTTTTTTTAAPAKKTIVKKRVVKKKVVPKKEEEEVKPTVVQEQEEVKPTVVQEQEEVKPTVVQEETPVEETTTSAVVEDIDEESSGDKKKGKKAAMKKEDFIGKFEYLFSAYEEQLKAARKQPNQTVSLHKYLTCLKNDVYKILKLKKRKTGDSAASGFMKPVSVSTELRSFLGNLNADEEITRVLVTRKLCEYIKQNSLQQNEDKRFIIPDSKLKSLFAIAENDNDTKLSYYGIQQLIQRHITKKVVDNTSA